MSKELLSGDLPNDFDILSGGLPKDFSQFLGKEKPAPMGKFSAGAEGFRRGVEKYTHGILKPILAKGYHEGRVKDFEEAQKQHPNWANWGKTIGEIGTLAPLAAALPGAGAGIIPGALKGAATGALGEFAAHPEGGESRESNAISGGIWGGLGGGLLGGLGSLPQAFKGLKNKGASEAFRSILLGKNPSVAQAEKIYNGIEKSLEKTGSANNIKSPSLDWEVLGEHIPASASKGLPGTKDIKKLIEKGSYQDINQAQGMFSAWKRALEKRATMGANNTAAINAVENAERKLHGKLFERFMQADSTLAPAYQKANELYAKGMSHDEFMRKLLSLGAKSAPYVGSTLYAADKLSKGKK